MPAILLIPGNMCDERLWAPIAEYLASAGYQVRHAKPLVQNSIAAMAAELLETVAIPTIVIGFSMGAIVGAEMARCAPDRIAGLGLIAFNASADLPERSAVRPRQQAEVHEGGLAKIVAEELKPNYLALVNRNDADVLETVMDMALGLGPRVFVSQSEALRRREDLRPALPGFEIPVLLACGSEDRLCPPEWHRCWAELIGANATFTEIEEAGHLLPLEQPQALADALVGWLAKEPLCQTAF